VFAREIASPTGGRRGPAQPGPGLRDGHLVDGRAGRRAMTLNGTTGVRSEAGERRPDKTRCYRFNAQTLLLLLRCHDDR